MGLPTPMTKRQVQQFLGLAAYYLCFVPNFSMLAISLTDLTKNSQPRKVQWSEDCQVTVQAL